MAEQLAAQFNVELLAGLRIEPCPEPAEHHLPQRHRDEPDRQHLERRQRVVDQHLVDHVLEEQRRGEPKQVERERDQQDLADQLAVAHDLRDEPGHVEASCGPRHTLAGGHQHQRARPDGLKAVPAELFGRRTGALDQRGIGSNAPDNEPALRPVSQGRQRQSPEFIEAGPDYPGTNAVLAFGEPQKLVRGDGLEMAKRVPELIRVDRYPVHRQDRGEGHKPIVHLPTHHARLIAPHTHTMPLPSASRA